MTIDRAIEILNSEHREHYDGMDEVNEACRMGMEALERMRWIPCSEQNKIGDLKYDAQEREKAVVQLRKKWQAAEMFICTMCGHFDYSIDGNIVYGNKDCGEIVGYPCCKKFTPWIPFSERPPEERGCYLVAVKHWYDGKPVTREAFWNGADWLSCEKRIEITPRVTHWMPMPEPPKEENDETIDG